ncbi:serpin family protein [Streptomyces sp. NBC_00654]|uniref:serpin family protein n=1 Tax=Streptomyces sp. NBC_00654 TaxID=2975799 RepID=UPI00224EFE92|nr:serpin family protein [Streptomyces sp. NBC_00654]MCX4969055.1 serpin family protein [Streptomyces sp. NBC_00654]
MERAGAVRRLAELWTRELAGPARPVGESFVCSPAGLWLALAAVAAGARGETADELRALLGVAEREAGPAVTEAARELARTEALGVATRVWSRVPVYRAYRESLPDIRFGAMDPAEADAWVCEVTGGLIEKLPLEITDEILLVLVNALALKARWEVPFEGRRTHDALFTDAAGVTRPVPTMHKGVALSDAWTVGGAYVVELRCRTEAAAGTPAGGASAGGAPARVRFVLGEPGAGAAQVLPAGWAPRESGTAPDADDVTIAVPRLTLRTTVQASEQLPALGVRRATSGGAEFPGLSPEPLAISQVVQEAVLKIAEEGVEAAAVTVVAMRAAGALPRPRRVRHIAFDRPFGVVVLDGAGATPLFAAWQGDTPVHEG